MMICLQYLNYNVRRKMGVEFSDPFPSKNKPEVLLTPFKII
jgi:hypothetical protein